MKSIFLKSITILLFIGLTSPIFGQDNSESVAFYKKNQIHGSLGTMVAGFTANAFYDRILSENPISKFSTFARVGYQGNAILLAGAGHAYIAELGLITGKHTAHFEAALGVTYIKIDEAVFSPAFSIGYRGQKPNSKFMFRTGIGFPELLYIGIGMAF